MAAAQAHVVICGQGTSAEDSAHLQGAGRPGEIATPSHWNILVSFILRDLVPSWISRGFGFRMADAHLLFLAWADDFTFVASGIAQLEVMLNEFAQILLESSIHLNEKKSKWFANGEAWREFGRSSYDLVLRLASPTGVLVQERPRPGYSSEEGQYVNTGPITTHARGSGEFDSPSG
eukprot:10523157-Karenia_brevis.AAC.1